MALHREGSLGADALDRMLHSARIVEGTRQQKRFEADLDNVPRGAMIRFPGDPGEAWLVRAAHYCVGTRMVMTLPRSVPSASWSRC